MKIGPHRQSWMQIIRQLGAVRVAEVGVWDSLMPKVVLANLPEIKQYWAIDPWNVECASEPRLMKLSAEEWDRMYFDAVWLTGEFRQLRVLRMTSEAAAKMFRKDFFDTVFIDGDHAYDAVLIDVESWLPKVKSGGVLCGHDFHFATVRKAVTKLLGEVEEMPGNVWAWRKE